MIHLLVPAQTQGGVYDFACKLQTTIGDDLACLTHLSDSSVADWKVGPDDEIVLQFSGYGFSRRGIPIWLLHALETRRKDIKRLGIYFHELYAFGPPWTSSFWLSPIQRHIARRLAELADFWMTNREGSGRWLEGFAANKPHAVLPVFSNVGESVLPAQSRLPRIIVFGSPGLRQKTYQAAGDRLFAWAKQASLVVHDIGAPIEDMRMAEVLRINGVILHGSLNENEVSYLMDQAMFGVLAYPVHVIAKSGVFAAYCAHGVCPILISDGYEITDGLIPARNYLPSIPSDADVALTASMVRDEAWSWYQAHNLAKHAEALSSFIGPD